MSKESGENLPYLGQMESSLRDRIAAAVVSVIGNTLGSGTELGLDVADAVIAELGLWQQWSNWHPGHYRWVTDWKVDNATD
jgi:hypothetical protein